MEINFDTVTLHVQRQHFHAEQIEDAEFEMIEDYDLQERLPQPINQDAN